MDRARDSRARILCLAGLLLLATSLNLAPPASAEPPAADEYALEIPGALEDRTADTGPLGASGSSRNAGQGGTSGENLPPQNALDSASSLAGGPVPAVAIAALALLALSALAVGSPRARTR